MENRRKDDFPWAVESRLLAERLRGERVKILDAFVQELVPTHQPRLPVSEQREELLDFLLKLVEIDASLFGCCGRCHRVPHFLGW